MHKHHGTLRLLIQMLAVVLVGAAAYVLLVYGLSRHEETSSAATTTPVATLPSAPSATSSPIMASSSPTTGSGTSVSTTTPDWEKGMQVITNSDNNSVVHLTKNERFVIQLGTGLQWSLAFEPAAGITRVPNSTTANGIQGIYEADGVGTTTLHATGAPICDPHQACPMFLAVFTATFVTQ